MNENKEGEVLDPVQTLITGIERLCRNVDSFADMQRHDFVKETAAEMLRLLSELKVLLRDRNGE